MPRKREVFHRRPRAGAYVVIIPVSYAARAKKMPEEPAIMSWVESRRLGRACQRPCGVQVSSTILASTGCGARGLQIVSRSAVNGVGAFVTADPRGPGPTPRPYHKKSARAGALTANPSQIAAQALAATCAFRSSCTMLAEEGARPGGADRLSPRRNRRRPIER